MTVLARLRSLFLTTEHDGQDSLADEAEKVRKRASKAIDSWDAQEQLLQDERRQRKDPAWAIRSAQRRLSGDD